MASQLLENEMKYIEKVLDTENEDTELTFFLTATIIFKTRQYADKVQKPSVKKKKKKVIAYGFAIPNSFSWTHFSKTLKKF